ncbi:hypothetical protein BT93_K2263 [Corymbia citriodora subsp. variegata]|nr:hypothetical protein BT93_K2263 [Corymbia citriodora subsp. variegata]
MWGGVTRLKQHLASIKGNVIPCRSCPPKVKAEIQEYLGDGPQENEEKTDSGREQAEIQEYLGDGSQENEENIDSSREQENDMRGGGNEEQLQSDEEYWPEFVSEINENLPQGSQKNEANMDGVSKQVNDMIGVGNVEQLQQKQECWQKSVADDMFAYLCEAPYEYGWLSRNQDYEMDLKPKNDEYDPAVEAALHESKLTFWEDRIRRGEGCSGTKPVPSCQEIGTTSDDSDDSSDLWF